MSASEFEIIRRYFDKTISRHDVLLGIGDDCALVTPPDGKQIAMTADTLVSGVHFPSNTSAQDIAYKSIAVNLSDLAAMGAEPAWLMLALTIPESDEHWLSAFAESFHTTCLHYGVQLIGGDTTRGPLSVTVHAAGFVESHRCMRRDAAKSGDRIYVTGSLGDAALGLRLLQAELTEGESIADIDYLLSRLNRPEPRVAFGIAISEFSRCAIDISDGLLADLGHVVRASDCGAQLFLDRLPLSDALRNVYSNNGEIPESQLVLSGGDDYELCFTLRAEYENTVTKLAEQHALQVTQVGVITNAGGIVCMDANGGEIDFAQSGYQHF